MMVNIFIFEEMLINWKPFLCFYDFALNFQCDHPYDPHAGMLSDSRPSFDNHFPYFIHFIECPPLSIKYGSTLGNMKSVGARVAAKCDAGYKIVSEKTAVCMSNGTWTPIQQCTPSILD